MYKFTFLTSGAIHNRTYFWIRNNRIELSLVATIFFVIIKIKNESRG